VFEGWWSQKIDRKEDVHRLEEIDWTKSPTKEKEWKQMMVHAKLKLTMLGGTPEIIDVFASHNKSGEDPKDFPKKIAQARFLAIEVKKVKKENNDTHVFVCSDFNTDVKNDADIVNKDYDTHSQFEKKLGGILKSSYKDVYGEHLPWTCVKTRDWMHHVKKEPNQPEKLGATSADIDIIEHCDKSVVLSVSNLLTTDMDIGDYYKSFPSKHAFSDHGKPLLCEFALSPGVKPNDEEKVSEETSEEKRAGEKKAAEHNNRIRKILEHMRENHMINVQVRVKL
jgi:hypothetical protein